MAHKSWRKVLLNTLGPGSFGGITFGTWLRVLRDNQFAVDPPCWGRALVISVGSLLNTAIGSCEHLAYARKIQAARIEKPVFILGIFRSGTTLLHNLLAQDSRFAVPNLIQVHYPRTFLTAEFLYRALAKCLLGTERAQDAVGLEPTSPQEDEWAICNLTGRSLVVELSFPRRAAYYRRFYTLEELTGEERDEWLRSFEWFLRKLAMKYQRPLVLKSPGHTCRIKRILELFPDARFVHIHRDPYAVFQSWQHMVRQLSPQMQLQRTDHTDLPESILRTYQQVYNAYLEQSSFIPAGRLHEISFEALEMKPLVELRELYRALDLPPFEEAESAFCRYTACLAAYRKNQYPPLSESMRGRIADAWGKYFKHWGYAT